jgi:hypothetical protein
MAHAFLSPSAAHRWIPCPGSLYLEQLVDRDEQTSEYAEEGTAAHELAEHALRNGCSPHHYVGETFNGFEVDAEMAAYVERYCDTVRSYVGPNSLLLLEQRVSFSAQVGMDDQFGTVDAIIVNPDEIIIVDLKYGKGVPVSAVENEQQMIYALGAWDEYGWLSTVDQIRMVISQPRIADSAEEWACSLTHLLDFRDNTLNPAVREVELQNAGEPKYNPGEKQCRFCPAKAICPALREQVMDELVGDEELTQENVYTSTENIKQNYTNEQLAQSLEVVGLVEMWCRAVKDTAQRRAEQGETIPGYKLVEGKRGARKWADAEAAEKLLRDASLRVKDIYKSTLISPTQAEKLLKKQNPKVLENLKEYVDQPSGKPTLVEEDNPKPDLNESIADSFEYYET